MATTKKTAAQIEQNKRAAANRLEAAIAGFRHRTRSTNDLIPYTPTDWNESQLAAHRAPGLDEAFKAASSLAAGWYRRAVTIDYRVTESNDEEYMLRPSEVAVLDGWTPCYTVAAA